MIEKGLYELLTQDTGVSTLVGSRVFYILAPKGSPVPFIVVSRVVTNDGYAMSGHIDLMEGLFQFDCYAADFYTSRGISAAVRALLKDYRGTLSDGTTISASLIDKDWDMPYEEGGKGFVYRALLSFRFHYYDESLPVPPAPFVPADVDGGSF